MKTSLFAQEIERVGLNRTHAEKAFELLRDGNNRGPYDVLYHRTRPKETVVWAVLDGDDVRYFLKQTAALAYLFACADKGELKDTAPFDASWETNEMLANMEWFNYEQIWNKLGFQMKQYKKPEDDGADTNSTPEQIIELLKQFYQIILFGPPGTGKTYTAKEMLAGLLGADKSALLELQKSGRWDIVQFHPSYNYEDFVRGVQVNAEDNQIAYNTENRTFGEMCKRAAVDKKKPYALIIDEINRANVSAVLGELIYALEYRGKAVKTPYSVGDGQNIIIPENLYIIGTMNTADRTIGQIDYAVRRRFAFVECLPSAKLVKDKNPGALHVYQEVQKLFRRSDDGGYLSSDFDADDVRIGHSYFLADMKKNIPSNRQIGYKVIWQVAPILHEYVKDGILLMQKNAEGKIDAIERIKELAEELAKKSQAGESAVSDLPADDEGLSPDDEKGGKQYFYWRNGDRSGVGGVGRTAFGVIKDFIAQNPNMNAKKLGEKFSHMDLGNHGRVRLKSDIPENQLRGSQARYFGSKEDSITLGASGETVCVSNQWGANNNSLPQWEEFKQEMARAGYVIGQCHIVSLGEGAWRSWECCHMYNFVSSGGSPAYHTVMKSLNIGDIIFVYLAESASAKGCIAYGQVVSEAELVREFITPKHGKLAECEFNGEKYADKFRFALEGIGRDGKKVPPDMAVGVEWLPPSPIQKPIRFSPAPQGGSGGRISNINSEVWQKLCTAFNLHSEENLE